MHTRDIYESGFDEESGRTLTGACPECDGSLETDGGETSCVACGLIVDCYYVDHAAEPRSFPEDETSTERTGAPLTTTRHDRGLSTEIGWDTDGKGNRLSARKRRQLRRLRREHTRGRWRSKAERNLADGLGSIARLTGALDLPYSLREQASSLFRTAQSDELLVGRSIEGIAAGCVYAVCRVNGITRTMEEVAESAQVEQSRVLNGYRTLNEALALPVPPQSPSAFVRKLASELDLPPEVIYDATMLAERAHTTGTSAGRHPAGFAATCLGVVADEYGHSVMQRTLADAAGVSALTVRNNRETVRGLVESPK
ncbi:transcription initiation factor IIB [Haloarcula nitratireducens]|uniref:Transcription initiation factor IIB family protein n=1 Tax=Haloarcula nitratireducens TaxID=2487749 RepID=A0AAW4PJJ3_9EURY|nr:transcription initiation factor IIB family protein [Halomicroarcula nitratireducens]MBX0298307.1 transcription initiation factor IIB family protein [Halomicroarcula nitratireducens]